MDDTSQNMGGVNSTGTNLTPGSDFSMSQNVHSSIDITAKDNVKIQPTFASGEQSFSVNDNASKVSNNNNNTNVVVTNTSDDGVAEDSDLIEKEWVVKAKTIVENTQNNPYLQSQKIAELRTEYLQKRYGKSLQEDA